MPLMIRLRNPHGKPHQHLTYSSVFELERALMGKIVTKVAQASNESMGIQFSDGCSVGFSLSSGVIYSLPEPKRG